MEYDPSFSFLRTQASCGKREENAENEEHTKGEVHITNKSRLFCRLCMPASVVISVELQDFINLPLRPIMF